MSKHDRVYSCGSIVECSEAFLYPGARISVSELGFCHEQIQSLHAKHVLGIGCFGRQHLAKRFDQSQTLVDRIRKFRKGQQIYHKISHVMYAIAPHCISTNVLSKRSHKTTNTNCDSQLIIMNVSVTSDSYCHRRG